MIRIILYVLLQTSLGVFATFCCEMVHSQLKFNWPFILFIILNNVAFLALYFKQPGYLPLIDHLHLSKSKLGLSPKNSQKEFTIRINSKQKVLNSSLIIHKNRMFNSHEKLEREPFSQEDDQIKQPPIKIQMDQTITAYIEQPQCTICYILQPLRAKHCKRCNRCVATYDHHNPLIQMCVGEKNKLLFLMHLVLQCSELVCLFSSQLKCFTATTLILDTYQNMISFYQMFLFSLIIFQFLLILYHFYLIATNQTQYENQYMDRITQLKSVDCKRPFSRGLIQNCAQFFRSSYRQSFSPWTLDS